MAKCRYENRAFELPLYMKMVLAQSGPALVQTMVDGAELKTNIEGSGSGTKIGTAIILATVAIAAAAAEGLTPEEELRGLISMAKDIVEESAEKRGQE